MTILAAFDQSPEITAYCIGDPRYWKRVSFGEFRHADFGGIDVLLHSECRQWLTALVRDTKAEHLCTEQIIIYSAPNRANAVTVYQQFCIYGAFCSVACDLRLPLEVAPVAAWRRLFLGTARAPDGVPSRSLWFKAEAMKAAKLRGWACGSHHQAEAAGVWNFAAASLSPAYAKLARSYEHEARAEQTPLFQQGRM
jgi:hypothetical protein